MTSERRRRNAGDKTWYKIWLEPYYPTYNHDVDLGHIYIYTYIYIHIYIYIYIYTLIVNQYINPLYILYVYIMVNLCLISG